MRYYETNERELHEEIAAVMKKIIDAGENYDFDIDTVNIHMQYPSEGGGFVYGFSTMRPNSLRNGRYTYDNYMIRIHDKEDDMVARLFISDNVCHSQELFTILKTNPYKIMPPHRYKSNEIVTTPLHDKDNTRGKATYDIYKGLYEFDADDDSWEAQLRQQVKDGKLTNPIE